MKRVFLLSAFLVGTIAAMSGTARATEVGTSRMFGLGVQLFEPTALIGKLFLDRNDALDFGIGFYGLGYGTCYNSNGNYYCNGNSGHNVSLHFDYLYEEPIVNSTVRLDWHAGAGGRLIFGNYNNSNHDAALLARVPLGLDLTFRRPQWLEAYLEVAPALVIVPPLYFDIDIGLGVRAYF
jgi:hypothetical protein